MVRGFVKEAAEIAGRSGKAPAIRQDASNFPSGILALVGSAFEASSDMGSTRFGPPSSFHRADLRGYKAKKLILEKRLGGFHDMR
jgi:hypothetical protein